MEKLISRGTTEIYLCAGKFNIPLDAPNITYIGIEEVMAIISSEKIIDFDALNIKFKNISFDETYERLKKSPAAMYELGKYYLTQQDYVNAVEWVQKAGAFENMWELVRRYYHFNSPTQDCSKAVEWYQKAAERGHIDSMSELGDCYYYGRGVMQDYSKAVEWYYKAAKDNDAVAMYNLGVCYQNAYGVPKDLKKAKYWYRKAADAGDVDAQKRLAEPWRLI